MTIQQNPVRILSDLMKKNNWHQSKVPNSAQLKWCLTNGKVSHEKATETLELLGWKKLEEEKWVTRNES